MKKIINCVGFALKKNNKLLLEKRKKTKLVDPNLICIPTGGIEKYESIDDAVKREVKEEFGVKLIESTYIGTLIYVHEDVDFKLNYFIIDKWDGKVQTLEAESLKWYDIENAEKALDIYPDKLIINSYVEMLNRKLE